MSGVKVSGREIIARLKASQPDRAKVSLYLSKQLFGEFKTVCKAGGVSASEVMEDLMRKFVDSLHSESRRKKR